MSRLLLIKKMFHIISNSEILIVKRSDMCEKKTKTCITSEVQEVNKSVKIISSFPNLKKKIKK